MIHTAYNSPRKKTSWRRILTGDMRRNWIVYLMVLPVVIWYIMFCYKPMWGAVIAFYDYKPRLGLEGSPWVGTKHFEAFFSGVFFWRLVRNTVMLNVWNLFIGFPAPIVLALIINEVKKSGFKRSVQTLTYLPYFISTVVVCGILHDFCASDGLFVDIAAHFGWNRMSLLGVPNFFRAIYTLSGVWQGIGWGSIIYLAALGGISDELYDAASIDGCGRIRRIWHVTMPGIAPTIIIMLILQLGNMLNHGYEKVILLYNGVTYETADIISTYVYRVGLRETNYSFASAVGLFSAVINFALIWIANAISRAVTETSLW